MYVNLILILLILFICLRTRNIEKGKFPLYVSQGDSELLMRHLYEGN